MTMPSDELHNIPPVSITDFSGISIQDALKFQKMIRARVALLVANTGMKSKAISTELKGLDVALSVYISEEIGKQEG
jgi:hypothetical protein